MKPKTLAVLAASVAGLAAFVFLYERKLPSTDERKAQEKRAFRLEADELVALELEAGGRKVRLERDPKPEAKQGEAPSFPPPRDWRLVEPMTAKADRALADKLATDLAGLEIVRRIEGAERKDVGLEPGRGTLRWKSPEAEGTLELGGEVPASSNVVVAVSGRSELLVVGNSIAEHLERTAGDWRAKEVVAASREEIERIRLVPAAGGELVLSRKGDAFVLERPLADAADRDAVDPLLSDLTSLRAERFLDAPLAAEAEAGFAAAAGRIELSVKGRNEPISIELGAVVADAATDPSSSAPPLDPAVERARYVKVGGQAIEAKTRLAESLAKEPEAWRSKSWTGFDSWKVERIRVEDAAGKMELKRDAGDWRRDGVKISYTEVGDLLYAITSARAERVLAGAAATAASVGTPRATLVFSDANGAEETLTLHAALGGEAPGNETGVVAARVSGRDVVLALPQKAADELLARIETVRKAKAEEEKAAAPAADGAAPAGADAPPASPTP